MAEGVTFPAAFPVLLCDADIDLSADTIRAMLLDDTYTRDNSHDYVDDVLGYETDATGYSRQTLTMSVSSDSGGALVDAADLSFGAAVSGGTNDILFLALYKQVGGDDSSPGDDPLIAVYEFALGVETVGGPIGATINASGLFRVDPA